MWPQVLVDDSTGGRNSGIELNPIIAGIVHLQSGLNQLRWKQAPSTDLPVLGMLKGKLVPLENPYTRNAQIACLSPQTAWSKWVAKGAYGWVITSIVFFYITWLVCQAFATSHPSDCRTWTPRTSCTRRFEHLYTLSSSLLKRYSALHMEYVAGSNSFQKYSQLVASSLLL